MLKRSVFSDKPFMKKLIHLVLPITFQQFMMALVSACDALMLGGISQEALSAVSLAAQVGFIHGMVLLGLTLGLSLLAAQYWGKGDIDSVEKVFAFSMKLTIAASLLFTLATLLIPEVLMRIFTPEVLLISYGAEYLRIISFGYLISGISQLYICILKNSGRAALGSTISCISMIINIVFNALLIYGQFGFPRLEIAGAAIATMISRVFELVWAAVSSAGKGRIKLRLSYLRKDDKLLRHDYLKYSLPVIGNQITWGVGFTMYSVIMGHLGNDAVAAYSIANIIKNLTCCLCYGLASGGGILVGNELGAGNLSHGKLYGQRLIRIAFLVGILTGLVLLLLRPMLLQVTNLTDQASYYLKWMIVVSSINVIGASLNCTTIGGIFCAGGDSKFGFICDTITLWAVIVPLGACAAFVLEFPVLIVYGLLCLDELIKLPVVFWNFRKYRWVRDLTLPVE